MCGLAISIASFAHFLRKVDFDAVVDHLAIMHIMRSKVEPATARIKRMLEVLSSYSFNLYYIKGKDMILSDFLSRQNVDYSNPCKIIPISFNLSTVLQDKYYSLEGENEKYMIQSRSQMKASGVQLPEVHGSRKGLDPHKIPEKQPQSIVRLSVEKKPRLGQGRAGVIEVQDFLSLSQSLSMVKLFSVVDPVLPKPIPRGEVLQPHLLLQNRPPPKPPDQLINKQDIGNTKIDIEENSPFQENIISQIYESLISHIFKSQLS